MTQFQRQMIRVQKFCCAAMLVAFCGCMTEAATRELSLATVQGEVKLDGAPAPGVTVKFVPRGATRGQGAYAVTDADGKYVCLHTTGVPGCEEGDYSVTFSRLATRDGKPIPEGVNAADVEARETLPGRLQNPDSGLNKVTVKPGENHLDFALKAK